MAVFDPQLLDALSVPLGDLIASVGRGVADAQREMDAASIAALRDIYENTAGLLPELQRIGYRPNWYHIPEVEGDIQIALTVAGQRSVDSSVPASGAQRMKIYAAPIDAGYTSRFNFSLQASSRLRFRIVPVPPSNAAEAMQVMPALLGLPVSEARARLSLLAIPATIPEGRDAAPVTGQTPAAGSLLLPGATVTVEAT